MSCNLVIHDELKNMEETTCPFCDKQLVNVENFVKVMFIIDWILSPSHAVVNKRL